jgi:hypothetical protein
MLTVLLKVIGLKTKDIGRFLVTYAVVGPTLIQLSTNVEVLSMVSKSLLALLLIF